MGHINKVAEKKYKSNFEKFEKYMKIFMKNLK